MVVLVDITFLLAMQRGVQTPSSMSEQVPVSCAMYVWYLFPLEGILDFLQNNKTNLVLENDYSVWNILSSFSFSSSPFPQTSYGNTLKHNCTKLILWTAVDCNVFSRVGGILTLFRGFFVKLPLRSKNGTNKFLLSTVRELNDRTKNYFESIPNIFGKYISVRKKLHI